MSEYSKFKSNQMGDYTLIGVSLDDEDCSDLIIPCERNDLEYSLEESDKKVVRKEILIKVQEKFGKRNRQIFMQRILGERTLSDIAKDFGMTAESVRLIVAKMENWLFANFKKSYA